MLEALLWCGGCVGSRDCDCSECMMVLKVAAMRRMTKLRNCGAGKRVSSRVHSSRHSETYHENAPLGNSAFPNS